MVAKWIEQTAGLYIAAVSSEIRVATIHNCSEETRCVKALHELGIGRIEAILRAFYEGSCESWSCCVEA